MRSLKTVRWIALVGIFAIGAFVNVTNGDAAAVLTLSDGISTRSIADGGIGDINPLTGVVTYSGSLPGSVWIVNVTTGITTPIIGDASFPRMDLNSVNVSSFGAGTLGIDFMEDAFSGPVPGFDLEIGGITSGSISYSAFYNDTLFGSIGAFSGAFADSQSFVVPTSGTYSLRQHIDIVHSGYTGITSFNASVSPIPEPGTLLLLGSGLVGLAGWGRKKMLR